MTEFDGVSRRLAGILMADAMGRGRVGQPEGVAKWNVTMSGSADMPCVG